MLICVFHFIFLCLFIRASSLTASTSTQLSVLGFLGSSSGSGSGGLSPPPAKKPRPTPAPTQLLVCSRSASASATMAWRPSPEVGFKGKTGACCCWPVSEACRMPAFALQASSCTHAATAGRGPCSGPLGSLLPRSLATPSATLPTTPPALLQRAQPPWPDESGTQRRRQHCRTLSKCRVQGSAVHRCLPSKHTGWFGLRAAVSGGYMMPPFLLGPGSTLKPSSSKPDYPAAGAGSALQPRHLQQSAYIVGGVGMSCACQNVRFGQMVVQAYHD